ncbi:MAG: hypothetical protein H6563_05880 [Lewinellaceae bacterium]|nr:hypothetical protein [Lewinellaceae bacterium]
MDASTAIIALVFIGFVTIPFVFLSRNLRSKDKQLLTTFDQVAKQENLRISQKEFWDGKYGIGIDPEGHKLLYIKKKGDSIQKVLVDLSEVEKCRILNKSRSVRTHNTASKVIDFLGLALTFSNSAREDQALEFYNVDESLTLGKELLLTEKWLKLINAK